MPPPSSGYHQTLRDYLLLLEYTQLVSQCPPGVYVIPSRVSLRVWHGVIFIRGGWYKQGKFRFTVSIPKEYPESPPSVFFTSRVYHPCVDARTGEVDLMAQFPEWNAGKHFLLLMLMYIKRIFYVPQLWEGRVPYNVAALNAYKNDRKKFESECEECCLLSNQKIYDPTDEREKPALYFTKPNSLHQGLYQRILESAVCRFCFSLYHLEKAKTGKFFLFRLVFERN